MRRAKRDRYHHGDLRAALIDTAMELIAEQGVHGFSLAEASRRLEVAVSAPYRHFADRDELLVAAGVRASEALVAAIAAESAGAGTPERELVGAVRGYVRFALEQPARFETIFGVKADHPELERALRPVKEAFHAAALAVAGGDAAAAEALAAAIATNAHGYATSLQPEPDRAAAVVAQAAAATRALIAGRAALGRHQA
jgi:AcrR family transcriptional regulator